MTAHELKKHCNTECNYVGYRCILLGISRNQVVNILNNSALEDKGVLEIEFNQNKTPVEIIKEGGFGGTYFRDIYADSGVNRK